MVTERVDFIVAVDKMSQMQCLGADQVEAARQLHNRHRSFLSYMLS